MPQVTREVHIEAPPGIVRRLVTDPVRRARWLDDALADPVPDDDRDGVWTYDREPEDQPPSRVRIELVPDGDGSTIRIIERTVDEQAGDGEVVAMVRSPRSLARAA